ncbi:protein kinase domain-containing protein [Limnofasciculus baicalensis]|uniref:non-specific serine/threonine protein kinase n=1 Tax=Limnofasciculus baicalensis BBK-W-15 TaxID=2699891 RepID=A0AAE3KLT0_9CYAN|nr:protein kinase [Limnofasciculus baicalensis]MCP2728850.1 protein kinase [Limnofasciculus baicalensis BBK-W-15]
MKPIYCTKGHENPSGSQFCSRCGEKLTFPVNQGITPGLVLGERYRIVRELGHGGFGRTYLAEDLNRFNEPCALKEFAPQVQGTYALQKAAELFEREAGVLYRLQHSQIPRFRELFRAKYEERGYLLLVQDFVAGQTYRTLLSDRKRQGMGFTEAEAMQLLRQIIPVLGYIHSKGAIHRDISPDNLMIRDGDGLPVLIDFGGVKQIAASVEFQFAAAPTVIPTRLGKIGYAPQEQMQNGIVHPNSDLYALAATLLVLLTSREPQQLIDPRTLGWNWRRHVSLSPSFGNVLDKMLQQNPGNRYQSASEVMQAVTPQPSLIPLTPLPPVPQTEAAVAVAPLEEVSEHEPSPAPDTASPPSRRTPIKSLGWFKTLLIIFGLIIGAGAFGWWAGNMWIQSKLGSQKKTQIFDNPVVSPNEDTEPAASTELSAEEQKRKESLRQKRLKLGIEYKFYVNLVNEAFWTKYPRREGQQLGTGPEDEKLREEWDKIAEDILGRIEQLNLSPAARQQIGRYDQETRDRWIGEANQLSLSSKSLYDLADAKFFQLFKEQQGQDFRNQPIVQVWFAVVSDTVKALKSGEGIEKIAFESGGIGKQISGILKPGEGKAFIAELSKNQVMDVKLTAKATILFSIYSPSGKTKILEDSRDRSFSGTLPESGFYEFVVVSNAREAIDYQFDLTVKNSPSSEASP